MRRPQPESAGAMTQTDRHLEAKKKAEEDAKRAEALLSAECSSCLPFPAAFQDALVKIASDLQAANKSSKAVQA